MQNKVKCLKAKNLACSRTQEVTCFFQTGDLESDHLQRSPLDFRLDFQVLLNGKVNYMFDCGFT